MNEKIIYYRGQQGLKKHIQKLLEKEGVDCSGVPSNTWDDPDVILYVRNNKLRYVYRISELGAVIMTYGEPRYLVSLYQYKFQVGEKVMAHIPALNLHLPLTVKDSYPKDDQRYYRLTNENFKGEFHLPEDQIKSYMESCLKPRVKTWKDLIKSTIEGYRIYHGDSSIGYCKRLTATIKDRNIAATEEDAKAMLAMAQVSQLMPHYGGMITEEEWLNPKVLKYVIERIKGKVVITCSFYTYSVLAFRSRELAQDFLTNNSELVNDLLKIKNNETNNDTNTR